MSNQYNGDLLRALDASDGGIIRAERVWQHRHDIDLADFEPRTFPKRALVIGTSAIVLGLASVVFLADQFSHNVPSVEAIAAAPAAVGKLDGQPAKLQNLVAVAPASGNKVDVDLPHPLVVPVPINRPVLKESVPSVKGRAGDAKENGPASVARFDECSPRCESRDPLVTGSSPKMLRTEDAPFIPSGEERGMDPASALEGVRSVFNETAAAPFTALKVGRDVLNRAAGLD